MYNIKCVTFRGDNNEQSLSTCAITNVAELSRASRDKHYVEINVAALSAVNNNMQ